MCSEVLEKHLSLDKLRTETIISRTVVMASKGFLRSLSECPLKDRSPNTHSFWGGLQMLFYGQDMSHNEASNQDINTVCGWSRPKIRNSS